MPFVTALSCQLISFRPSDINIPYLQEKTKPNYNNNHNNNQTKATSHHNRSSSAIGLNHENRKKETRQEISTEAALADTVIQYANEKLHRSVV